MSSQRFSYRGSIPRKNLQYASWNTCLHGQFRDAQRRERGLFGRFYNDGTARRQGRTNFPSEHQKREVPRQYNADHPNGFTHNHRHRSITNRCRLIIKLVRCLGVPFDCVDGFGNIDQFAVTDRFTAVEAFHDREFSPVSCHQFAQTDQHVFAFCGM